MDKNLLKKHFKKIGADLSFSSGSFAVDVRDDKFVIRDNGEKVNVQVVHSDPKDRHLLLFVKTAGRHETPVKMLCGHDERHWFVARVERKVTTCAEAKDSLKPEAVREEQRKKGTKRSAKSKRHNNAYIRQGEWFFMPRPDLNPPADRIMRNEPLRRANARFGNAHLIEEMYRVGGTTVYVSRNHRQGVTEKEYKEILKNDPMASKYGWTTMRRNPRMYARGSVRHNDHATIYLDGWHEIVMNNEKSDGRIAYLD